MVDADVGRGGGDDSGGDDDDDVDVDDDVDDDVNDDNYDDNLSTHGLPSLPGWLACFLKSLLKISPVSNCFFE